MTVRSVSFFTSAMATFIAAVLPAAAAAQMVLPAAYYFGSVANESTEQDFLAPGTYILGGASISVIGFPQPSLVGRAGDDTGLRASFSGDISYSFTVDGPASVNAIPLFAMYDLHASAIGSVTNAIASLSITGTRNDFFERVAADGSFSTPASIFATRPVGLEPGVIGVVSLGVGGFSDSGLADAYVDPFIFVDPAFLADHPGYTVRVSAGVGNAMPVTSVPEPETYAMMLVGLGLLATTRRRAGAARQSKAKSR
jgi:PEP-CTERM motif